MNTAENLYSIWKHNLIAEMEAKRDILVLQAQRGRDDPLFEITSPNDKLYQKILEEFDRIAVRNAEWLIYTLCRKHSVPADYGQNAGNIYADLVMKDRGKETLIDIKSDTEIILSVTGIGGRIRRPNAALLRQKEYPVVYIILQKDSDNSRRKIARTEYELNQQAESAEFRILLFEDFILEYFGQEELDEFKQAMRTYKDEMHNAIGYQITEIMNSHNLRLMKNSLEQELLTFDYDRVREHRSEEISRRDPDYNELFDSRFDLIRRQFLEEGGYRLLLGDGDFAVSFMTSEWLYKKYFSNEAVDNTFIVAGYLKSIEQLLWDIIWIVGQGREIKKKNARPWDKVMIGDDNVNEIDQTLGSLQYFITDYNNDNLFSPVFRNSIHFVMKYLRAQISDWRDNYRNGYFHKHNLKDRETVEKIREGTIFLYFLILGSLDLNEDDKDQLMHS